MHTQYPDDYPAELELDFDRLDLDEVALQAYDRTACPLCSNPEYKHHTARNRCELCGNYVTPRS